MAIVHGVEVTLSDNGGFPEYRYATEVSADTFRLIGREPILGRDFTKADEVRGAPPVAILNYSFWERQYGKDASIVGRAVRINGELATVIGVMPPGFIFPQNQDLWVPLMPTPNVMRRANRDTWFVFGRMADGATIESARAEMEAIGRRLEQAYPLTNKGFPPIVRSFAGFYIGPNASVIYGSLWGAVGFVLLIACANLANLMLARALGRSREIPIRIALGAGRWRVVRQLLIESTLLSAAGGFLGWWLAKWGVRAWDAASRAPGYSWFDHVLDYTLDYRVLAYLIAISAGTGILFGLAPALRLSKLDVNAALKDGGKDGGRGGAIGNRLSGLDSCGGGDGPGRNTTGGRGFDDSQLPEHVFRGHWRSDGKDPYRHAEPVRIPLSRRRRASLFLRQAQDAFGSGSGGGIDGSHQRDSSVGRGTPLL